MNILGVETSCDETAAAVVKDGSQVLSNIVATSLKDHQKYGGIIPEIASRRQLELITAVTERSLQAAKIKLQNIDVIAVTQEPGLIGSLLVGVSFARALAAALKKPLVPVNHIQAHLYSAFLQTKPGRPATTPKLPVVGLIVSGGHTSLYFIRNFKKFELLGQTRDDAAGEALIKLPE
jgi:N6-L-threonylcarbamoyladenine synthase